MTDGSSRIVAPSPPPADRGCCSPAVVTAGFTRALTAAGRSWVLLTGADPVSDTGLPPTAVAP